MKKRSIALLLALFLVFGAAVGGTVAWLTAETTPVVNTFTVGDINIELKESENLDLKMVPGTEITKDPKVTAKAGSEACWLFVQVDKSANFDTFMEYSMDSSWTALGDSYPGVFYYNGTDLDSVLTADKTYSVLNGDKVTVKDTVTKGMLNALTADTYPTLTFTAYAVQKANIADAATAWGKTSANSAG